MKVLKTTIIGILVFTIAFLFLPTGLDGNETVSNFMLTTSYAGTYNKSGAALVSPYIMEGTISGDTDEGLAALDKLTTADTGWTGNLYEVINPDGTSTFKKPDYLKSNFANEKHVTGRTHGGTDMTDAGADVRSKVYWTLALLPGKVQIAGRDTSYGHYLIQTVDGAPGLYILYAHMGNGNAWGKSANSGRMPSWQSGTSSSIQVKTGDTLVAGQRLGYLGTTGDSTGPHSHVELRYYKNVDGSPRVFPIGEYPQSAGHRSNAWQVIHDGKSFSEISWMWYENGKVYPDNKLTKDDLEYLEGIVNTDGDVGAIDP